MTTGRRRAVAPVIATVILIAITIVAGASLYGYAHQVMVQSSVAQVAYPQDAELLTGRRKR